MITEIGDKIFADFSTPASYTEPITVSRVMPDGSKKILGYVSRYGLSSEDDPTLYVPIDAEGNKICSATTSWSEIENEFERHARKVIQTERAEEVEQLRERKNNKEIEKEITI